jgi:hypothetical protein
MKKNNDNLKYIKWPFYDVFLYNLFFLLIYFFPSKVAIARSYVDLSNNTWTLNKTKTIFLLMRVDVS